MPATVLNFGATLEKVLAFKTFYFFIFVDINDRDRNRDIQIQIHKYIFIGWDTILILLLGDFLFNSMLQTWFYFITLSSTPY